VITCSSLRVHKFPKLSEVFLSNAPPYCTYLYVQCPHQFTEFPPFKFPKFRNSFDSGTKANYVCNNSFVRAFTVTGKTQQCDSHIACCHNSISLMKQQFIVTHTICQIEIPALLDSWVTNTPSVKMFYPQKKCLLYFCRNIRCIGWSLKDL
jgi:hypothetical protein